MSIKTAIFSGNLAGIKLHYSGNFKQQVNFDLSLPINKGYNEYEKILGVQCRIFRDKTKIAYLFG